MKKNLLLKLLFILLISLCFTLKVNAGFSCDTYIRYDGIVPTNYDVRAYYCEFKFQNNYNPVGGPRKTYYAALRQKKLKVLSLTRSTTDKIPSYSNVTLCNEMDGAEAYVLETVKCVAKKQVVKGDYVPNCKCVDKVQPPVKPDTPLPMSAEYNLADGCPSGQKLECNGGTQYYKCPDGYTGHDSVANPNAVCEKEITLESKVTKNTKVDVVEGNCKTNEGTDVCTCEIKYQLYCPVYSCQKEEKILNSACVEKFELEDGTSAFCVNPSEEFPVVYRDDEDDEDTDIKEVKENNYQYNYNFDVQKCSSSHSTIDCGYSNIMIEREYYNKIISESNLSKSEKDKKKINDNSVNLALRLWAAHSRTSGFDNVGIANTEGPSCSQLIIFHDDMTNVYRTTLSYISSVIFEHLGNKTLEKSVEEYSMDNPFTVYNLLNDSNSSLSEAKFRSIPCETIGLTCSRESTPKKVYQDAFALYFNTVLGNGEMLSHLQAIFGGKMDTTPEGATLVEEVVEEGSIERTYSRVEVTFEGSTNVSVEEDVIVDCDTLNPGDPYYDLINPYCKVTFTIVDGEGNVIVDETGKVLDQVKVDECNLKSFGCYSKKFRFALCDFVTTETKAPSIIVHYTRTKKSYSVRKYTACSDTNHYQTMFAFYNDEQSSSYSVPEEGKTSFSVMPSCRLPENECSNFNVRKSTGSCENTDDKNTTYGNVFTSYVKDPPLNCIINSRTKNTEYDYSNLFGVNTDVCRVYCSDSVEYIMADKIRAKSGTSVKFDIEFQASKMRRTDALLTNIIREKRTCVSQIYLNANKFQSGYDWEKEYGITNEEITSVLGENHPNILNVIDLIKVLYKKSQEENNRLENIKKLVFDLYNCNLYKKNDIPSKVRGSNAEKVKYIIDEIYNRYSVNNNFGLSGCSVYNNAGEYTNDCVVMGNTYYEGGAELATSSSINSDVTIGKVGDTDPIIMGSYASKDASKERESTVKFALSTIKYCSGSDCITYNNNDPEPDDYEIYNSSKFSINSNTDSLKRYVGDISSETNFVIPTNDYAIFEVVTDFGFYNSNKFVVFPDTGHVKDITNDGNTNGYITIDPYSYPSSKNAYNECSIKDMVDKDGKPTKYNRCKVTYNLSSIHTYERNYKSNVFFNEVNEMNKFNCYIDFEPPQLIPGPLNSESLKDNTLYRNIDITKMFNNNPPVDSNWLSDDGIIATAQIQNSSKTLKSSDDYLEYSITITPTQINNIREDINMSSTNKGINSYSNERIYNCEIIDNTYRNCKSTFLDELRRGSTESAVGTYGTIDPNYSTGVSKHTKEVNDINNNLKYKGN